MNYIKITKNDIANGPGMRVTLWVSGCSLHCKSCHNPQTWDFNTGKSFDNVAQQELFDALNKSHVQGFTISGGHPLEPENINDVYNLLMSIKTKFPQKDIWLYTGYTLDILNFTTLKKGISPECIHHNIMNRILNMCDVVIDGPYIEEQRDITLPFCGSKNQRLIDVQETLKQGQIIHYKIN